MKLEPVPEQVAQAGLRAVKSVGLAANEGTLSDLQSRLIVGIQDSILHSKFRLDELEPISPEDLAKTVTEPRFQARILRAGIIAACINGEMNGKAVDLLDRYAGAMGTSKDIVATARKLADHHLILARIDIVRKSLPGVKIRQTVAGEGILAAVRQFFPLLGLKLSGVTEKYRRLENYPEGTLGKEYINYMKRNGFPLPGEKGAGPEIIVVHDCLHILGDYGTTSPEEIEIASFQAGCQFEDPIYGILFGLAQYHLNVQVAPVAPSDSMHANPEKMLAAFARGCKVNRDMWRDFNPWDHFEQPVDALRKQFGVVPK